MVIIGHRSSKSTFGANKMEKFCNSYFQGLHNISLAEASCTERVSEVLFDQQLDPVESDLFKTMIIAHRGVGDEKWRNRKTRG